jgi:hypothetical protein
MEVDAGCWLHRRKRHADEELCDPSMSLEAGSLIVALVRSAALRRA